MLAKISRPLVLPLAALLALSVLIQAFFAGAAAFVAPEYWQYHKIWISLFQWLSVPLAIAGRFGTPDWTSRGLAVVPIILIGAQYSTIHLALGHGIAWLAGLHAVGGFVLFGVLVLLIARQTAGQGRTGVI